RLDTRRRQRDADPEDREVGGEVNHAESLHPVALQDEFAPVDEKPEGADGLISNETVALGLDAAEKALGGSFRAEARQRLRSMDSQAAGARRVGKSAVHGIET